MTAWSRKFQNQGHAIGLHDVENDETELSGRQFADVLFGGWQSSTSRDCARFYPGLPESFVQILSRFDRCSASLPDNRDGHKNLEPLQDVMLVLSRPRRIVR